MSTPIPNRLKFRKALTKNLGLDDMPSIAGTSKRVKPDPKMLRDMQTDENKIELKIKPDFTAVIMLGTTRYRYRDGELHSIRYPAVEYVNGTCEFWIRGEQYTFTEWCELAAKAKALKSTGLALAEKHRTENEVVDAKKHNEDLEKENAALKTELAKYVAKKETDKDKSNKDGSWYKEIEVD